MNVTEKLARLRELMKENGISEYLVPTADFHDSEYAGEHFAVRKWLSGFTGSAGTLVVTLDEAALWADGRYFIQAENQLKGSTITLMKMGEEGVPELKDYVFDKMPEGGFLGFDGRVISAKAGEGYAERLKEKNAGIKFDKDLAGSLWEDRPAISAEPAFLLDTKWTGKTSADKLKDVRKEMEDKKADALIITCLDDIAWLYNIRGNDIPCNPVVMAYTIVEKEKAYIFVNETVLNDEIRAEFKANGVEIRPYNDIYEFVKGYKKGSKVMMNKARVNYAVCNNLDSEVEIVTATEPTTLMKCRKNETEIANLRASHIKDGVAVTKFMYWLKKNVGKIEMSEISASDYLEERRREQKGFIELSFDTISAYNANAAMMHYKADETSNASLKAEGMLLVDSGGQYYEGTTDITRTFILGSIKDEWKKHFTLAVKGMLNLANAHFLYGCRGINLDILCRAPLWNIGIDYRCGTGHGVGYLLNVHEAPNGFRWKIVPERSDSAVLEEGMVTTDEPGVYEEGSHGIRIENELVCKKAEKNEYGQWMEFETITYAPIDLEGIDKAYLNPDDVKQLNAYHKMVFEKLSPYFEGEELEWLKEVTREI
ncbi:MAG: aminopeptidase P family protein [Lachnospiraceae bacterium]|nr:aminopeptidase P family protein [Lachnospiraceae bacterium]